MCWFRLIRHLSDVYRTFKPLKSTESCLNLDVLTPSGERKGRKYILTAISAKRGKMKNLEE